MGAMNRPSTIEKTVNRPTARVWFLLFVAAWMPKIKPMATRKYSNHGMFCGTTPDIHRSTPPAVRASERASQPITRLSNERSTWVCVWSISCGNITLKLPQNAVGYTIAVSYTDGFLAQLEPARNDACLWPGAAAGRLRLEHRTGDPHADPQPSRARHGADRKFDPGATAGRGAAGQHRLRVPGGRRHHAHDGDLLHAVGETADRG